MSQHPSLSSSDKDKQHRSVLKRYEKVKILKDKEKWKDGDSVYGLPKVKIVRFKIKKEKAAAAEGAESLEGAAPGTEAAPTQAGAAKTAGPAKGQAPAKGAASKEGAKPAGEGKKEAK
ncbi:MAG: small basic protein [Candidatus Omnitrophota bacterium]